MHYVPMNTHTRRAAASIALGTMATVGTLLAASYSIATYWEVTGLADAARETATIDACADTVSARLDVLAESVGWDYVPNLAYSDIRQACAMLGERIFEDGVTGYVMVTDSLSLVVQGYGETFFADGTTGYAAIMDSFGTYVLRPAAPIGATGPVVEW